MPEYRLRTMTPTHSPDDPNQQRDEFTRQMVEVLQDKILDMVETFAEDHPDCDLAAYPVAIGQAFVAQCLKTYGVQGFDAAAKQSKLIIDEMEKAFRHDTGDYKM